jgi:hypothetical protein
MSSPAMSKSQAQRFAAGLAAATEYHAEPGTIANLPRKHVQGEQNRGCGS